MLSDKFLSQLYAQLSINPLRLSIIKDMITYEGDLASMADNNEFENNCKSKLILQVHDELVVETAKDEFELVKKLVKNAMELNQPLKVPLLIDINAGETWKEV